MTPFVSQTQNPPRRAIVGSILAIALLVTAISLAAGAYYFRGAQNEFDEGLVAYKASKWLTAYQHFEQVGGFYRFGPSDQTAQASQLKDECSLLAYAEEQYTQQDYFLTLEAYTTYLNLFPNSIQRANVIARIGQVYIEWIAALRKAGRFTEALDKGQELATKYPEAGAAKSADELLASIYADWAVLLTQQSEFGSAIEKLEIVRSQYPQTSVGLRVEDTMADTYLQWAQALSLGEDYGTAIEIYTLLRTEFGNRLTASEVQSALAEAHIRYANQLRARGQPASAILSVAYGLDIFEQLLAESPQSVSPSQLELMHGAYETLGQQMVNSGHFLNSLALYMTAQKLTGSIDTLGDWQTRYESTLRALGEDSGTDGQYVIDEASKTACQGQPTSWSVIGTSIGPAKARLCSTLEGLTLGIRDAQTPADLHYVIDTTYERTTLQTCPYTGGHFIARERLILKILVYEAATGSLVKEKSLLGSLPAACPSFHYFSSGFGVVETWTGDEVDTTLIQQAVDQLLEAME